MTETDLSTWLTIAEAATALRCSDRTVERLAASKKLEQRLRPQRGSPDVAVFSPQSVAEEAQRRHRAPAAFVVQPVPANGNGHALRKSDDAAQLGNSQLRTTSAEDLIRQFFALAVQSLQSPPSPPVAVTVAETLFLTIPQAAAVSGLSPTYLRRLIKTGELPAEKDRGWKIRRADLEAL